MSSVKCSRTSCARAGQPPRAFPVFEEVSGAGHDDELLCATELGERGAIERKHPAIVAAADASRSGAVACKRLISKCPRLWKNSV